MGEVRDSRKVKRLVSVAARSAVIVRLDGDELLASFRNDDCFAGVLAPSAMAERLVADHTIAARGRAIFLGVVKRDNGRAVLDDVFDFFFEVHEREVEG